MATSDDMREQIRSFEDRFDGLEKKFDGLEKKVDQLPTRDDLAGFKDEIIKNFRILAEDAKDSVKKAADPHRTRREQAFHQSSDGRHFFVPSTLAAVVIDGKVASEKTTRGDQALSTPSGLQPTWRIQRRSLFFRRNRSQP